MKIRVSFTVEGSQLPGTLLLTHSTIVQKSSKLTLAGRNQGLGGWMDACPSTTTITTTKQYRRLFRVQSRPVCPSPTVATWKILTGDLSRRIISSQLPKTPRDFRARAGPMSRSRHPRVCVGIASLGRTRTAPTTWWTRSRLGQSWGHTAPQNKGPNRAPKNARWRRLWHQEVASVLLECRGHVHKFKKILKFRIWILLYDMLKLCLFLLHEISFVHRQHGSNILIAFSVCLCFADRIWSIRKCLCTQKLC